jgi:hypothetical protein
MSRLVVGLFVCANLGFVAALPTARADHAADCEKLVKALTDCMRECESCSHHCAKMVADGHKHHMKTLRTCQDCAEFCAATARIVSRDGPMVSIMGEACTKACNVCGKACEEHASDETMRRCARACRDCERACRDMVQHHTSAPATRQ